MDNQILIDNVLKAKSYTEVVSGADSKIYKSLITVIHPDICKLPLAGEATLRLNQLKDEYEKGKKYYDQAGEYLCSTSGRWIYRSRENPETKMLIQQSLRNSEAIIKMGKPHLNKYIPYHWETSEDDKCTDITLEHRAVPLSDIGTIEQKHVNWILSRMLEFTMMLNNAGKGYVHAGISPDTIYVVPENHGIVVTSFYNMVKIDDPIKTYDSQYKNWYPPQMFNYKTANSLIDTDMAKKTAIWLLGDKSGVGNSLKKTHHPEFMEFVTKQHKDPYKCFIEYREMLDKNFKKEFHTFNY